MQSVIIHMDSYAQTRLLESISAYEVIVAEKKNTRAMGANEARRVLLQVQKVKGALNQGDEVVLEEDEIYLAQKIAQEYASLQRKLADMRRLSAVARQALVEESDNVVYILNEAVKVSESLKEEIVGV